MKNEAAETLWDKVFGGKHGAGRIADVLILIVDRPPGPLALAAWGDAVENCLLGNNGHPRFSRQVHLLPPAAMKLAESLKQELASGEHRAEKVIQLLQTSELREVITALRDLPRNSAVVLLGLETIRARDIAAEKEFLLKSWTGLRHRTRSQTERHKEHLVETVKALLVVAKEQELFVTGIVNLTGSVGIGLAEAVGKPENLIVIAAEPTVSAQIEERLAQVAKKLASGSLSVERAIELANRWIQEPERRALAHSQLFFIAGRFSDAWEAVEPFLDKYRHEHPAIYLNLGHAARAAMRSEHASRLLHEAINEGITSFEDLHTAYLLADQVRDQAVVDELFERMRKEFPNEEVTLAIGSEIALRVGNYSEAERIARQKGNQFEADLWSELAKPTIDLESLLRRVHSAEQKNRIYATAALEMERRGDFTTAESWAREVHSGSQWELQAMRIRIRCFGHGLLTSLPIGEYDVSELVRLLDYVALNVNERELRIDMERLFEETVTAVDVTALLGAALHRLIPKSFPPASGPEIRAPTEKEMDAALDFVTDLLRKLSSPVLSIGFGEIPKELKPRLKSELIQALLYFLQQGPVEVSQPHYWTTILKAVELGCRAIGDPSKDLVAGHLVIQRLAADGGMQAARDLAEHILQTLPDRQPQHRKWRIGLAWAVVAESFAMTRNPISALIGVCLSLAAFRGEVIDPEVFCIVLRLATRIQRDLNLGPLALRTLKIEKQIRQHIGATSMLWQLEQVGLSIELQDAESTRDRMQLFLKCMRHFRSLPPSAEKLPVLSLAVGVARAIRADGVTIPSANVDEIKKALSEESGFHSSFLAAALRGVGKFEDLRKLIQNLGQAARWEDLATQLRPAQLVAEDALETALRAGDYQLFGLAASLLSQPILASRVIERTSEGSVDQSKFREWALQSLRASVNEAQSKNAAEVLRKAGQPQLHSIMETSKKTIADLGVVLTNDEAVLFVTEGLNNQIYTCLVRHEGALWIRRLSAGVWSPSHYGAWRCRVPNGYGRSESPSGNGWQADEIRASMEGFTLEVHLAANSLIIIPSAALFSFPFQLITSGGRFLGEMTQIAVVPSFAWFIDIRKRKPSVGDLRLWAGDPSSLDPVLDDFRKFILPNLRFRAQKVVLAKNEREIAGAAISIVVIHGVPDEGGGFRSLTDGSRYFTAAELAEALKGSECVVLCVCYGGKTSVPTNTTETRGVITALLAVGVRTIVASQWPVSLEVIQYWLPSFLESVSKGKTIGESIFEMRRIISKHINDDAAPATFCVIGDPTYAFT